jgi:hypothetical protein
MWSLLSEKSITKCSQDASTVRSSKAALMNRENPAGENGTRKRKIGMGARIGRSNGTRDERR